MTKYVLTLAEGQMKKNAENHVKIKNDFRRESELEKDKWAVITLSEIVKKIKNGDSLYINTHGWCASSKDKSGNYQVIATDKADISVGIKAADAKQFYEFVKGFLPTERKFKLKMFSCYSAGSTYEHRMGYLKCNFFAGKLAALLYKSHPLVLVYGYRDETKLGATREFPHQTGGMVPVVDADGQIQQIDPNAIPTRASAHRTVYDLGRDVAEYNWLNWIPT